ncbi:hypothetical protein [Streptomyces olivaceus]|uniref:hypothetical protein n=1 Tax=Streptomyces olivaceus TaxID=47716 RepID=UPI001884FD3C|nr:hypothetical protein [Streptomyces olivaceus]
MAEPSNKTILLMDMEGSGRRRDSEQSVIHRMLYTVLHETLSAAAIEPTEYRSEDRGDGVFVLIHPAVPKPALLRALLTATPEQLVSTNRLAAEDARIRLRIVVHTGEVALDEFGAVGADLVHAFRLLDAPGLRKELATTSEPSVLCVSDAVYQGVVRHAHPGVRPEHFHPLTIDSKEGATLTGWYHDNSRPHTGTVRSEQPAAESIASTVPARATATVSESERSADAARVPALHTRTGNFFFGTASVAGDAIAGDKHVGTGPAKSAQQRGLEGTGQ